MEAMPSPDYRLAPRFVPDGEAVTLDFFGPTLTMLVPPEEGDDATPCVIRGVLRPGDVVPLHAHPESETFVGDSGILEGLVGAEPPGIWTPIRPGDTFHIPGSAPHAFRNVSSEPAVVLVTTPARLGRFFLEVGAPVTPGEPAALPTPQRLGEFAATSERYGQWLATPAENAGIGLDLPPWPAQ
jgi:quercetin dioxygenase-like cupin family protein